MKYKSYTRRTQNAIMLGFVILSILLATGIPRRVVGFVLPSPVEPQELRGGIETHDEHENATGEASGTQEVVQSDEKGFPSQAQKDVTEKVCSERFSGALLTSCYYDILAIAWVESRWRNEAVGDGGKSFGPFQIYTSVHKHVAWEQATDYAWSARWTLDRMIRNGYPQMRSWALGGHNSYTPEQNEYYGNMVKEKSAQLERQRL